MIFLGAESLAGAAATHSRLMVVNSRDEHTLSPIHWEEHEQSVAAAPILWKTKIAGCLLISSIQPHIFSETYLSLVEIYAYLMALAFERETFFDHQEIKLALMPLYTDQPRFLKHFSQRVYQKMNESAIEHQPITFSAAQERVCQEVEGEMLRFLSARSK
jgi:transcriptional regulator with GAF, ATPase, and Fis domain